MKKYLLLILLFIGLFLGCKKETNQSSESFGDKGCNFSRGTAS